MNLKVKCSNVSIKNRFYSIGKFDVVIFFRNNLFDFLIDGREHE